jgi:hypothetical protein
MWRWIIIIAVLVVTLSPPVDATAPAPAAHQQTATDLTIRVNENGFFDMKKRRLGPERSLRVPAGAVVRLTFVFDESVTSLAVGDTHQIAVRADDGWVMESEKIRLMNKTAVVSFRAGEQGRKRYRLHCILDCMGMEHLANLVIEVVSGSSSEV